MIVLLYLAAIVAANVAIAFFGPVASPIVAFVAIGLDLTLRDKLHERWRGRHLWVRMFGLIVVGGLLSYMVTPAAVRIAVASSVAFVVSSAGDAVAYDRLRRRSTLLRARVGSNLVGAALDSLIFPTIAFAAFLPVTVLLQFLAKGAGGWLWAWLLTPRRPRYRIVHTEGSGGELGTTTLRKGDVIELGLPLLDRIKPKKKVQ